LVGKFIKGIVDGFCYVHDVGTGQTMMQKCEDGEFISGMRYYREYNKKAAKEQRERIKEKGYIGAWVDDYKRGTQALKDMFNPFAGKKKK